MRRLAPLLCSTLTLLPSLASAEHGADNDGQTPAEACEHPRGDDGELGGNRVVQGFLTVTNPNLEPVILVIDGHEAGTAAPGTTRFGPFSEGSHVVEALWSPGRGPRVLLGMSRVRISSREVSRFQLERAKESLVELRSDWVEPMEVQIDGRRVGELCARGSMEVLSPHSGAELELIGPRGEVTLRTWIHGSGLQSVPVLLAAPQEASILVENPTRRWMELRLAHGPVLGSIPPLGMRNLAVRSGSVALVAMIGGRVVDEDLLVASPWRENVVEVDPPRSTELAVHNPGRDSLEIFADGVALGVVGPHFTVTFRGVEGPEVDLVARIVGAGRFSTGVTFAVDPWESLAWSPAVRRYDGGGRRDHMVSLNGGRRGERHSHRR